MILAVTSQAEFYREFLMKRGNFNPKDFGVDMSRTDFKDKMIGEFADMYHGMITVDELLLHPTEALRFVGTVKHKYGYFDVPEDIILRSILNPRKNPNAKK